jgi:hypothetical protein
MVLLVTLAFASSGAATAAAQTVRGVEASAGYQVLHIPDETYPFGINLDVSTGVTRNLKAVGEFGWARDSQDLPGGNSTLNFVNLGGGARWSLKSATVAGTRSVEPYVQFLLGAVHAGADIDINGSSVSSGTWAFMLQPGAGVTVPFTPVVGLMGQVDYRRAFFDNGENEFRFIVGVRVGQR